MNFPHYDPNSLEAWLEPSPSADAFEFNFDQGVNTPLAYSRSDELDEPFKAYFDWEVPEPWTPPPIQRDFDDISVRSVEDISAPSSYASGFAMTLDLDDHLSPPHIPHVADYFMQTSRMSLPTETGFTYSSTFPSPIPETPTPSTPTPKLGRKRAYSAPELFKGTKARISLPGNGVEDVGASCHQCKRRRPNSQLLQCNKAFECKTQSSKRQCRKRFCVHCLVKYEIDMEEAAKLDRWWCPACCGDCDCASCKRRRSRTDDVVMAI